MDDDRNRKATQVESIERRRSEPEEFRIGGRGEQIDRIPDASLFEQSLEACEDAHGHTPSEATFDSCRNWIRFQWRQRPGELWRHREPFDFAPRSSSDEWYFRGDSKYFFLLLREDIAKPTDARGQRQNRAQNAEGSVRDQACEQQSDAERKNDGPSRQRRKDDRAWRDVSCLCS